MTGKGRKQWQSCHAGGGTEAGGLPHGDRPWSPEFSGGGNELHRCVKPGGEQGGFLRRVACQVLPSSRLGEGAQALDALVDKFRDWQAKPNSISVELKG